MSKNERYGQIFADDCMQVKNMKRSALQIYFALLYHSRQIYKDNKCRVRQCFMSQQTLALYCDISTTTVARGIADLKKLGILTVKQQKMTSALYTITTQCLSPYDNSTLSHDDNSTLSHDDKSTLSHDDNSTLSHDDKQTNYKQNNNKYTNNQKNNNSINQNIPNHIIEALQDDDDLF